MDLNNTWHLVYQDCRGICSFYVTLLQRWRLIPRDPLELLYICLVGAQTTPFMLSAYMKGITKFVLSSL